MWHESVDWHIFQLKLCHFCQVTLIKCVEWRTVNWPEEQIPECGSCRGRKQSREIWSKRFNFIEKQPWRGKMFRKQTLSFHWHCQNRFFTSKKFNLTNLDFLLGSILLNAALFWASQTSRLFILIHHCPSVLQHALCPHLSVLTYLHAGGLLVIVFPRCLNGKMLKDVTDSLRNDGGYRHSKPDAHFDRCHRGHLQVLGSGVLDRCFIIFAILHI